MVIRHRRFRGDYKVPLESIYRFSKQAMKNLLYLFLSYMKLAFISMFLAAICFSLYAGYKSRDESFLQAAIGGIGALLAFYIVMVFLSLKLSDLWRNFQKLTTHRTIPGSPPVQIAPGVNWPVS